MPESLLNIFRTVPLGRNFFWMTWSGVISIANSVVVWIAMARMRDVEEVGRFAIVMGLFAMFFNLTALGLMPYLVNEISRRTLPGNSQSSPRQFITSSSVFLTIAGVICTALMSVCGFIVSDSNEVRMATVVLSLTMVPTNISTVAEAASIAYGRARLIAGVSTFENLIRTIVPIALIWAGYDIIAICVSFAVIKFLATGVYLAALRVHPSEYSFSKDDFRRIAKVSPTFASTGVVASINWQAPLFLLAYIGTEVQTAGFGAASRFLIPVSILLAGYVSTIQPTIARKMAGEPRECGSYLSKIAAFPLIASAAAAVGSMFLAGPVLRILFGEAYESSAQTLEVLVISVVPFCLVMVASRGLIAAGAQHIDLYANLVGLAAAILVGVFAIPIWGSLGAALAQLACFGSMALVELVYLSRNLAGFRVWKGAAVSSAGILSMYLLLWN